MKSNNLALISILFISIVLLTLDFSCKKDDGNNTSGNEPVMKTNTVDYVTQNTAFCGGKITDTKNGTVIECGICWSTNTEPTINDNKTIDVPFNDSIFQSYIRGLLPNTKYYIRSYATSEKGTGYGETMTIETSPTGIYQPGMEFQGGFIAYILKPTDDGYVQGKIKGMITTPEDQSNGTPWDLGNHDSGTHIYIPTSGGIFENYGDGKTNTEHIVAALGSGDYAARLCYDLDYGGHTDWYMPSITELNWIYSNHRAVGGFKGADYWSSSNNDNETAFDLSYSSLGVNLGLFFKFYPFSVRAIRYFEIVK